MGFVSFIWGEKNPSFEQIEKDLISLSQGAGSFFKQYIFSPYGHSKDTTILGTTVAHDYVCTILF